MSGWRMMKIEVGWKDERCGWNPACLFYRLMLTGRQTLGGGLCSGMSFEVLAVKVDSVLKSEGFGLC